MWRWGGVWPAGGVWSTGSAGVMGSDCGQVSAIWPNQEVCIYVPACLSVKGWRERRKTLSASPRERRKSTIRKERTFCSFDIVFVCSEGEINGSSLHFRLRTVSWLVWTPYTLNTLVSSGIVHLCIQQWITKTTQIPHIKSGTQTNNEVSNFIIGYCVFLFAFL